MSKIKYKTYDEVISSILIEFDTEQAEYQKIHKRIYGTYDEEAKRIYKLMTNLCETIRQRISNEERR